MLVASYITVHAPFLYLYRNRDPQGLMEKEEPHSLLVPNSSLLVLPPNLLSYTFSFPNFPVPAHLFPSHQLTFAFFKKNASKILYDDHDFTTQSAQLQHTLVALSVLMQTLLPQSTYYALGIFWEFFKVCRNISLIPVVWFYDLNGRVQFGLDIGCEM